MKREALRVFVDNLEQDLRVFVDNLEQDLAELRRALEEPEPDVDATSPKSGPGSLLAPPSKELTEIELARARRRLLGVKVLPKRTR